jgi:transcriptional regulator with XRE-family HTH domain
MEGLRRMRIERGFSGAALASIMGTTRGTISRWENGTRSPSDGATLRRLAQILNCTVDDLIGNPTEAPVRRRRAIGASTPSAG